MDWRITLMLSQVCSVCNESDIPSFVVFMHICQMKYDFREFVAYLLDFTGNSSRMICCENFTSKHKFVIKGWSKNSFRMA